MSQQGNTMCNSVRKYNRLRKYGLWAFVATLSVGMLAAAGYQSHVRETHPTTYMCFHPTKPTGV